MSEFEIQAEVSAEVSEGEAAEAAEAAAPAEADEAPAEEAEVEAPELNADGHPVFAGELFGGADAGQAVHEVVSEGF